ncbi:hypothetical protein GTD05_002378, partial [Salmonella enterica]|nr:hypothetical protein [Salmonella enterica]
MYTANTYTNILLFQYKTKEEMKMNTFKNKNTEIFYVVSLHIYAELFNSK